GPPAQLVHLAARLFSVDADVALADHADVAQQPIVEFGQRAVLLAPGDPPAQLPPRLPEGRTERDAEQILTRRWRTELCENAERQARGGPDPRKADAAARGRQRPDRWVSRENGSLLDRRFNRKAGHVRRQNSRRP